MNPNKKMPKNAEKFACEPCDFVCSKQSNFEKHLLTRKHAVLINPNIFDAKNAEKTFVCQFCKKIYKHASTLSSHKKICSTKEVIIETVIIDNYPSENILLDASSNEIKLLTNLVLEIVKSNTELQKQNHTLQQQMLDVIQKIQPGVINTVNNNNNHSNNKTFNLNFFLNEQCKDAMNIMDFVETFHLQFDDLERIGEVGYVEGISNLIIEKLNGMDIYKRPIHCSDAKREIMHIKDKGVWEKDNENNDKLRLAIKHITKKNIDLIGAWSDKYPGVRYSDHRLNDKFNEIIMEAMGGKNNKTMKEGEAKIIKKISKMVLIDKHSGM